MTQIDAYKEAGYAVDNMSTNAIHVEASRLAHHPTVSLRIQEYRDMIHSGPVMDLQERQERLSEIARGKTTDFIDADGNITTDGPNAGAIAEISVDEYNGTDPGRRHSQTKRIKLHNPIAAIAELNKINGDYAPERKQVAARVVLDINYVEKKIQAIESGDGER
jgi:phage terminase small subunit